MTVQLRKETIPLPIKRNVVTMSLSCVQGESSTLWLAP